MQVMNLKFHKRIFFKKLKSHTNHNYFTSTNLFVMFKNVCLLSVLCNFIEVNELKVIYVLNYVALTHQLYVLTLKKRRTNQFGCFR